VTRNGVIEIFGGCSIGREKMKKETAASVNKYAGDRKTKSPKTYSLNNEVLKLCVEL